MKQYPFLDLKASTARWNGEITEAVCRVVNSGRYIGGREVEAFEQKIAEIAGTRYAVGVSNGLDALRLILRAAVISGRLNKGDQIAVAANTYVASVLAITDAGLEPLLIDPDPLTMNLSADGLERALTERTRGVMLVHLYGRLDWDRSLRRLIERHHLFVIEDVAQAIGAYGDQYGLTGESVAAGGLGAAGAFSFYPTKNIGALGDAGAVTTSDAELASIVRALSNYGSLQRYNNIYQGFNCRLDPMQAAILNLKLPSTDQISDERREKAAIYDSLIVNQLVELPLIPILPTEMVWHQYVVRVDDRARFRDFLASRGVATDVHYATPPHLQPCYADLKHAPLPVTEELSRTVVSLPIAESTSPQDVREISEIVNEYK